MNFQKLEHAARSFQDVRDLDKLCGITLFLKRSHKFTLGNQYAWVRLDAIVLQREWRRFINQLNRKIYKSAHRKHYKEVEMQARLEKSENGCFHMHVAFQTPDHQTSEEFLRIVASLWSKQDYSSGSGEKHFVSDAGWVNYINKFGRKDSDNKFVFAKGGLEHFFDSVII